GHESCIKRGIVVEENTIVNEATFGKTSSRAAMVQSSYVGQRASAPSEAEQSFWDRGNSESRGQTIANGVF
ncbi:hypothetical protein L218DRAFT_798775, partial [Marasmius fiardii PR-910]